MPNQPLTGVVLVEVIGRDVLTWRVTPDPLHELIYSIDTADVPNVAVFDMEGVITEATVIRSITARKTIIQFRKRSPFYALLYRRTNFIEEREGVNIYTDFWRFQGERFHVWFFPPDQQLVALLPTTLHPYLGRWQDQQAIACRTPGLTIEVRTRAALAGSGLTLPELPIPFAAMLQQLAPPHGIEPEILRHATTALPEFATITAGSQAIRHLLQAGADP